MVGTHHKCAAEHAAAPLDSLGSKSLRICDVHDGDVVRVFYIIRGGLEPDI